jgi:hypothetical protein
MALVFVSLESRETSRYTSPRYPLTNRSARYLNWRKLRSSVRVECIVVEAAVSAVHADSGLCATFLELTGCSPINDFDESEGCFLQDYERWTLQALPKLEGIYIVVLAYQK